MIAASQPYDNREEARQAATFLEKAPLLVTGKRVEILEEAPPPPYTTASLLEDATTRLMYNAEQVMRLAQFLFEGIWIHGTHAGLITYHRTDSVSIAPEAQGEARSVIVQLFGKQALPVHPAKVTEEAWKQGAREHAHTGIFIRLLRRSITNHQSAINNHQSQQSHEAIRPTSSKRLPDRLAGTLDEDALALYRLIWERFIASQMKAARYRVTTLEMDAA